MNFAFRYIARTDQGVVRPRNEDAVKIFALSGDEIVALVCDGMGGHRGGELAANTATDVLQRFWEQQAPPYPTSLPELTELWQLGFEAIQNQLHKYVLSQPDLHQMGTTCAGAFFSASQGHLCWANLGDSRIYLLRKNKFEQLTKDHTLVEEWVGEGKIKPWEVWQHPKGHILNRALTAHELDVRPDVGLTPLKVNDLYLICSDGLSDMIAPKKLEKMLRKSHDDIEEKAMALIELAKQGGGKDNISVALVRVE